jgi:hypothetical protein
VGPLGENRGDPWPLQTKLLLGGRRLTDSVSRRAVTGKLPCVNRNDELANYGAVPEREAWSAGACLAIMPD